MDIFNFLKPGATIQDNITAIMIALLWLARIAVYIACIFVFPIMHLYFDKWAKKRRKIPNVVYEKDIAPSSTSDDNKLTRRVDKQLESDEDPNIVSLNERYTVAQMKMYAKDLGINNYQVMKKAELLSKVTTLFANRDDEIQLVYSLDHPTTKNIAKQMGLKVNGQTREIQDRIVNRRDEIFSELELIEIDDYEDDELEEQENDDTSDITDK